MKIMINASVINGGGSVQVTDSVCCQLYKYTEHEFIVVLSDATAYIEEKINNLPNIKVYHYNRANSWRNYLLGRDEFLDNLVETEKIERVITIFGPSRWRPRVHHLCGFARPHLCIPESPYWQRMPFIQKIKEKLFYKIIKYYFKRDTDVIFTENSFISERLQQLIKSRKVITITNYYNQVFDEEEKWQWKQLPEFDGYSFLTISAYYPHKNLEIMIDVARCLKDKYPDFKFRFVITIDKARYPAIPANLAEHFLFLGKVNINECPSLYKQSDVMFLPTLLECYSASYPEAMRMQVPIVTTDIGFAHGLCANAALYYSPLNAADAADCLYKATKDNKVKEQLIAAGTKQLTTFDNYVMRAKKMIDEVVSWGGC